MDISNLNMDIDNIINSLKELSIEEKDNDLDELINKLDDMKIDIKEKPENIYKYKNEIDKVLIYYKKLQTKRRCIIKTTIDFPRYLY